MTTVQPVNVGLGLSDYAGEATTPTTPRAPVPPSSHPSAPSSSDDQSVEQNANTPTTAHFAGMSGQRPLPTSPFRKSFPTSSTGEAAESVGSTSNKRDSQLSLQSDDSQDVMMADSDGEGDGGSDGETGDQEGGRSTKKKRGQRFFCTEFPPCKLSFTRSEHLARHIRKHTGERPFQCHCSRRFSRLDNLRQHAQTVHVNEDIPGDSLAATGTRFQRQIRTDRVSRPPHGRSRASTAGSTGSQHRGHGRNLSTSSIGSTVSTLSTLSRDDARRRPAPIIMAGDPSKPRLSLDVMRGQTSTPPAQSSFYRDESEGVSTPTSTTFSTGGHSPGYGSSIGSPAANARNSGYWENRGHGRRLSVPSGPLSFQSPQNHTYGSPYLSPLASSQASHFPNINNPVQSPTNLPQNLPGGREAAEAELRRRTWHPTPHTYTNFSRPSITSHFSRPATSGLVYNQTPETTQPSYGPPHAPSGIASQPQRLPGIETFDQAPRQPLASQAPQLSQPAQPGSPMQVDQPAQQHLFPASASQPPKSPHERRGHASWDMSLHQNLTKLNLRPEPLSQEGPTWGLNRPSDDSRPPIDTGPIGSKLPVIHQETPIRHEEQMQLPSPTPNRSKRQGWYAGPPTNPVTSHPRLSPVGSASSDGVPRTPTAPPLEHDPSIVHSNGYVESVTNQTPSNPVSQPQASTTDRSPSRPWPLKNNDREAFNRSNSQQQHMSSLDVLVAAAAEREHHAAPQA